MKAMGLQAKQPVVVWLLSELANTSNQMNFEQFLAGFEGKVVNSESREAAEKLFEALDDEKKGSLQVGKVQKVAKELGEALTEEEAREMVKRSGANGEEITREDFCRLMGKMTF
jgi:Ca2+-binding EF-hand superfamily protein